MSSILQVDEMGGDIGGVYLQGRVLFQWTLQLLLDTPDVVWDIRKQNRALPVLGVIQTSRERRISILQLLRLIRGGRP